MYTRNPDGTVTRTRNEVREDVLDAQTHKAELEAIIAQEQRQIDSSQARIDEIEVELAALNQAIRSNK